MYLNGVTYKRYFMEVQKITNRFIPLLEYLSDKGYSTHYMYVVRTYVRKAERKKTNNGMFDDAFFREMYSDLQQQTSSSQTLRTGRVLIRMLRNYCVLGEFPTRKSSRFSFLRGMEEWCKLGKPFKELILKYEESAMPCKKGTTIYHEKSNAISFFSFLQERGCATFEDVTEQDVISFFYEDGKMKRGASFRKNVLAVLRANAGTNPSVSKVIAYLPKPIERPKNVQYLSEEEIGSIKNVLLNGSSLCLRDKAIGILALFTGMRCCDIVSLTMDNIDFTKDMIVVKQQKTGSRLTLPLRPVVGNAIADYILEERPDGCGISEIFVTRSMRPTRLCSQSCRNISLNIMNEAGIRQEKGDRKGLHLLRHHFATHLLANNVPRPVISSAMGHEYPESLDAYLSSDFAHLKRFALSIADFPIDPKIMEI